MYPTFVNGLIVVAYLIFGTVSIALAAGWALKRFGPVPINCIRVIPHVGRKLFKLCSAV